MPSRDLSSPHIPPPSRLQDLPPLWARFCLRIERDLLRNITDIRANHLVLACSAGSDSLALLLAMRLIAPRLGARLTVAHLDHGLRRESAGEAVFLEQCCGSMMIPMIAGVTDVALYARRTGQGLEEAGRTLRYRFLSCLRAKLGASLIMTAHHADDLAEDVIMRLVRGVGWPGLAGMPAWDEGRRLARPLLYVPKRTLRDFLHALGVTWREDVTNAMPDRLRNRIRGMVLPHLHREQPRLSRNLTQLHALGTLDQDYFTALLSPLIRQAGQNGHFLARHDLAGLHPALRLRLFKSVLDGLGPGEARCDSLFRLERAWRKKRTGARIQFPGNKVATIRPNGVQFAASSPQQRGESPCV